MIDHTGLKVSDPVASRRFYETALAPLGYRVLMEIPAEHTGGLVVLGYGVPPKPDLWVAQGTPEDLAAEARSYTGQYLRPKLEKAREAAA